MLNQKKKGLVALLNSWRPFVEGIRGALKAKDFRKKTVCGILQMLDPDLSLWPGSLFRYVGGAIIGSGFLLGRKFLYGDIFRKFLERNNGAFKGAPLPVIQEFNKFAKNLFSENVAKQFFIEESLARRRLSPAEKLLARGERSMEQLKAFVLKMQGEQAAQSAPEDHPEVEEELPDYAFERKKALFSKKAFIDPRTVASFEKLYADGFEIDDKLKELIESSAEKYGRFVQNAMLALPKLSFGAFQDLQKTMRQQSSLLYLDDQEIKTLCSSSEEKRQELLQKKIQKMHKPFETIISQATHLKNDIEEMEKEMNRVRALLEPFMKKKDTRAKVEILLNELALLRFKESLLAEETATIEKKVAERKNKVKELLTSFQREFFDLLSELQKLQEDADKIKLGILHARWEIFSRNTPFPDLTELLERVEQNTLHTLEKCDEDLIIGQKSFDEMQSEMLDSLYTHNMKLLRWELLSRALRLKDIRGEVEKELLTLDRQIGLMKLSQNVPEELLSERKWLYSFFEKLLSPFALFKDTCDPESINVLFRYFWMDLDRFRSKGLVETAGTEKEVIHAFKSMQEIMEKISFGKTIRQSDLDTGIEAWLAQHDNEFALLPAIASYPYGKKEQFLRRLKVLRERKEQAEALARTVQAAKTFEPERIDALLEAFTLLRFPQNPFTPLEERFQNIEHILENIEEAIYCEIGFTDVKSRIEEGFAHNELIKASKKALPLAQKMVKERLEKLSKEKNFVGKVGLFLLQEADISLEDVFEAAHAISLLFFQQRLAVASALPNSFARPVLLFTLMRKIFSTLKKELPQEKGSKISELFTFSRQIFTLIFPIVSKDQLSEFLHEFAKRTRAIAEDVEISPLAELEMIEKELEPIISWESPIVSFVPGDLNFFLN